MKIARVAVAGHPHLARVEGSHVELLHRESDHPAADALREALALGIDLAGTGDRVPLDEVDLLSPVRNPSAFLGVGLNYRNHAAESGLPVPTSPIFFMKTPNAVIGPDEAIRIDPRTSEQVDYEVELAVIISRPLRTFDRDEAERSILGYTICNDVTARDAQFADGQWPRSKSFDTFAPLGPWIVTPDEFSVSDARLATRLNGASMQDGTTADMVFSPVDVVAYAARSMTLRAGDVITTGTPPGVGFARTPPVFLQGGDVVELFIEGIGTLRNPVEESRG